MRTPELPISQTTRLLEQEGARAPKNASEERIRECRRKYRKLCRMAKKQNTSLGSLLIRRMSDRHYARVMGVLSRPDIAPHRYQRMRESCFEYVVEVLEPTTIRHKMFSSKRVDDAVEFVHHTHKGRGIFGAGCWIHKS